MKTFIIALILMALTLTFAIGNSMLITKRVDELLTIAESFPETATVFEEEKDAIGGDVAAFFALWDKALPSLAYTSGYENLNRADEAAILLYASYKNGCAADFVAARYDFCDALRRLRSLETVSLSSVF